MASHCRNMFFCLCFRAREVAAMAGPSGTPSRARSPLLAPNSRSANRLHSARPTPSAGPEHCPTARTWPSAPSSATIPKLMAIRLELRCSWSMTPVGVRPWPVVIHGLSVAVGQAIGGSLAERPIAFCRGFAFLGSLSSIRRKNDANHRLKPATPRTTRFAFLAIIYPIIQAEPGDTTSLGAPAPASDHRRNYALQDSPQGTVCADAAAFLAGAPPHG